MRKIALVYDRINKWGGAERILLHLHKLFPDAPIYTSVYDPKSASWARGLDIRTSFLQSIPFAKNHHELLAPLMPLAFESFDFDEYDVVISLTSEAAKGIITKPRTQHICLCLTPTRYLWSEYKTYFPSAISRFISAPVVRYLKVWDVIAATRPDTIVSISKNVQDRVEKYYMRSSKIIYPPFFLEKSSYDDKKSTNDYFLVVSRLSKFTPHKKVELAVLAANKLGVKLKVVGQGDISYFKRMAGATVEIIGGVDDETLRNYYKNCKALVFPGVEDFGLVMVEAQYFGKPVIAFRAGGAREIIIEGVTGDFFDVQSVESLAKALKSFNKKKYNEKDCRVNAQRFSVPNFDRELFALLKI